MIRKRLFNTHIKIEKEVQELSDNNRWISHYILWKEMWASVMLKDISSRRVLYLFVVKWKDDFPQKFRVKINDKIFIPTQPAIADAADDSVIFHAILAE